MKLSDSLADLNYRRYQDHAEVATVDNAKQAALAFAGDTYAGLDAASLADDAWDYAQDHLRILSGHYGLLRPLAPIHPYRPDMGSRLPTRRARAVALQGGAHAGRRVQPKPGGSGLRTERGVRDRRGGQRDRGAVALSVVHVLGGRRA